MMNKTPEFALLANATSILWADVPEWPADEFVAANAAELERGGRLCVWFGVPGNSATRLLAVISFDADNTLVVGRSVPVTKSYPSLTLQHPQAHLFEREVWEQHGLVPEGHPWLKPVRRQNGDHPAVGKFFEVAGGGAETGAGGAVHAGTTGGRRSSRSRRRSGSCGHHRAGTFSFPVQRRRSVASGNCARLPASRCRGGAGGRAASRDDEPD